MGAPAFRVACTASCCFWPTVFSAAFVDMRQHLETYTHAQILWSTQFSLHGFGTIIASRVNCYTSSSSIRGTVIDKKLRDGQSARTVQFSPPFATIRHLFFR